MSADIIHLRTGLHETVRRMNLALGEALLPPEYVEYRNRVRRWRDILAAAGEQLMIERKARESANVMLADAKHADEQLRQTEAEHPQWKRKDVR